MNKILLFAVLPLMASAGAMAQDCAALAGAEKIESARYVLAYRTKPERVRVGEHFSIELVVCPRNGQAAADGVRVDGFMPEHNHGMNYKAVVKPVGSGRYEAAGMMFHMPGKWDFIFEVRGGGKVDRLTHAVTLQ